MNNVLFLKPYLEHKVWGSNKLSKYNINLEKTKDVGEAWIISGYKDKSSVITNGEFKNKTLYEVFNKHKELFDNYQGNQYPLLVKLLDCNDNLSVQVHPNNKLGKNECWYFLEARKDSNIVYGHKAKTKTEFVKCVKNNEWDKLLKYKKVKPHDLVYVTAGTLHALNKGLIVYELQQTSDLTYRLYDYNRNSRPIHIKESIACTTIPFVEPKFIKSKNTLIKTKYFELQKIKNTKSTKYKFSKARWIQATVIEGSGILNNDYKIKKGTSFIISSSTKEFNLDGKLTLLVSFISK